MAKYFKPNRMFKQEYYFLLDKGQSKVPPSELVNLTLNFVEGEDYIWAREVPIHETAQPEDNFDLWYFTSDLTDKEENILNDWNRRFERWRKDWFGE